MGKDFIATFPDGTERFAGTLGVGRATLFYEIALLLERFVGKPCGISPETGLDEHRIDPIQFTAFFESVWDLGWPAQDGGFVNDWAAHAAGMIENFSLETRTWVDRHGTELRVVRYMRPDEFGSKG